MRLPDPTTLPTGSADQRPRVRTSRTYPPSNNIDLTGQAPRERCRLTATAGDDRTLGRRRGEHLNYRALSSESRAGRTDSVRLRGEMRGSAQARTEVRDGRAAGRLNRRAM